jgi:DNA-binding NtrC family response regulator
VRARGTRRRLRRRPEGDRAVQPPVQRSYSKPILVVDDDQGILNTIQEFLAHAGYLAVTRVTPTRVVEEVREKGIEIVVSDVNMPGMDGLQLLMRLKEIDPNIAVIVMTAYGSEKVAVDAMKKGAYDYLSKPFEMDELLLAVSKAVERAELVRQNQVLTEQVRQHEPVDEMVGESRQMVLIRDLIRRVAASNVTVLVSGESGTGKELVAQAIVRHSGRAKRPFVKINCAALPESLLESELFGHEKGSFTGAFTRQVGKFELAHGGTLFLDEIGDMSLKMQTKLLRVLQEQSFERIGGKETIRVDVRVLAATNKDLLDEIRKGTFRDDLYYRLNVIEIKVSPLRDRPEDVPLLVDRFLETFCTKYGKPRPRISPASLLRLCAYHWPGNIRQIKNYMERIAVLELGDELDRDIESLTSGGARLSRDEPPDAALDSLEEAERRHITRVLTAMKGNRTQAAQILKIDPKTLRAKLRKPTEEEP